MAAVFFIKQLLSAGAILTALQHGRKQISVFMLGTIDQRENMVVVVGKGWGLLWEEKQHFVFLFQQTPETSNIVC